MGPGAVEKSHNEKGLVSFQVTGGKSVEEVLGLKKGRYTQPDVQHNDKRIVGDLSGRCLLFLRSSC